MRFLVFGVLGMAGHLIAHYLLEQGHEVIGFARKPSPVCTTIVGDAMDPLSVSLAIVEKKFDVVVNCIGVLNKAVDANLAMGIYLNSYLPHYLAKCCDKTSSKFVHISTDCVFTGRIGGYTEKSVADETSYYGRTKFLGEVLDGNHLTLRTSIVGPEIKRNGIGLFHWFMQQHKSAYGFVNVLWSGVTTLELAKAVEAAAEQNISGLYHLSNNTKITKYDLLQLFNQYCKLEKIEILKKDMPMNDKTLFCTRKDFNYIVSSYETMVVEMAEWLHVHKNLYAQYME
jgi:dTDP-4-dehydrorhamnose reductase